MPARMGAQAASILRGSAARVRIVIAAAFAFGGEDSEYIVLADGPAMSLSFGLSLGSGSF